MKRLIAAVCFMFALSPLALAQDKAKGDAMKAAPAATAPKADEKKATPVAPKADEKKAAQATAKAKKEPSEKQLAHREKMKSCSKDANDKKLKGDDRKKFMSTCLKG